MKGIALW